MGFRTMLESSTSSSIKQYQFFLRTNSPWDIERLLCKSELGCCDKVCYYQKPFAVNVTHYT